MPSFDYNTETIAETICLITPVNLHATTLECNFSCAGKARVLNQIYEDSRNEIVVWQPDVMAEARRIAEKNGIHRIIDVGCGNGDKLVHFFPETEFKTWGLDFQGSLSLCQTKYPERHWIPCNLTSYNDLLQTYELLRAEEPTLVVFSDVIEHLPDITPCVAILRLLLLSNPNNRLIVTSPDRQRQGYIEPNATPGNKAHTREWSLDELATFFTAAGFTIGRSGHTRCNQFDTLNSTLYLELTCHKDIYLDFLQEQGVLHFHKFPSHLLVTTEYANFKLAGGIGAFVREQREIHSYENTACLFVGNLDSNEDFQLRQAKLLAPLTLLHEETLNKLPLEDRILRAVEQIVFYLPQIHTIQYGDYQGIGCRVAQAKASGLLPEAITLIAHAHGTTHYLENANRHWYGATHFGTAEREKISMELADIVTFPTEFLQSLCAEAGINLSPDQAVNIRYPYVKELAPALPGNEIDTIMFYGKRSRMKGFNLFVDAVWDNRARLRELGITNLCFIGPDVATDSTTGGRLSALKAEFFVTELTQLGWQQAREALHSRAHHSICVLPYLGDNHPYALLDAVFSTVLPVMLETGGVPEMYPHAFRDALLAKPNPTDLNKKLVDLLERGTDDLHTLRTSLIQSIYHLQQGINERFRTLPTQKQLSAGVVDELAATIIVPVFNTPLEYIEDLIFGINNQTRTPSEVIFVDDASEPDYASQLAFTVKKNLTAPHRVIRHPLNQGLAGARNTGLKATTTPVVINIDSDDIPLSNFVANIVLALERNPAVSAAVPYLRAFEDGDDLYTTKGSGYVYRPLGDGVIASQVHNLLGHANAGFRTADIRNLGGWDQSSKAMWEDWALFLRIISASGKILVIPREDCLYRVRAQSMLRTYETWPAMRRLAGNMLGLPRYENFRLQSAMRAYSEAEASNNRLTSQLDDYRAAYHQSSEAFNTYKDAYNKQLAVVNRRSVRWALRVADWLAGIPMLNRAARRAGKVFRACARKLR